jgi:hypothetical protein
MFWRKDPIPPNGEDAAVAAIPAIGPDTIVDDTQNIFNLCRERYECKNVRDPEISPTTPIIRHVTLARNRRQHCYFLSEIVRYFC